MSNKMLIDATHPEETRVVVVRDKRVEDFDFEAASRKPLRGNIYLAKVTRVEPSLQACFVEYGGNRHGFLAFSEIHPDYYQIPQADRAALLAEERAAAEEADEPQPKRSRRRRQRPDRAAAGEDATSARAEEDADGATAARDEEDEDDDTVEEAGAEAAANEEAGGRDEDRDDGEDAAEAAASGEDGDGDDDDGRDDRDTLAAGGDNADPEEAQAEDDAADRRAGTAAASVRTATAPEVVASDVAATAEEREEEIAASDPGEEPTALARAAEQVAENIDADVETTDMAPRKVEEAAPAPVPADTVEAGVAHETSEATSEAKDPGAPGEPAASAAPEGEGGDDDKPAPRRRRSPRPRTRKTAEGLADPQVADDRRDDDDDDSDDNGGEENGDEGGSITSIGSQDALEEIPERRRHTPRRQYKIQEVIKRRQIILVQVVKEERGTKGAALTTYLSLAGRYCVLMPNTDRGGGVSRKITDAADRKRLKSIVGELDVPDGMGVILRTAGAARTKTEIKRDFEYLLRLWENVRELTLKSIAPQLVYEEGNLIKRSIRDLYSKEIEEVLVAGEDAYREAKEFMRMLMPSHAKNVKPYREATPIFTAFQVEAQLDAMFSPQVTLPSKGSIVINPTEALVAIDVNSGKSTKESSIEETALKTNLEAADEVARQLRLRDLAGLIVIDFIDMDDKRHNRAVEKRLKDALKLDRSRIQVGRISPFGLLEMSRQRIRQGMVETSMVSCPHCAGTGQVRSTQSVALHCLRTLEEHLLKDGDHHVTIRTSAAVALYILNQKRAHLNALEERFGLEIGVDADETLGGQLLQIVPGAAVDRDRRASPPPVALVSPDAFGAIDEDDEEDEDEDKADAVASEETEREEDAGQPGGERSGRRRRRRRRRGNGNGSADAPREATGASVTESSDDEEDDEDAGEDMEAREGETAEERRNRRRRGRRGGRRHRRENGGREMRAEGGTEVRADGGTEDEAARTAEAEPSAVRHVPIVEGGADEVADRSGADAARTTGGDAPTAAAAPEEATPAAEPTASGSEPAAEETRSPEAVAPPEAVGTMPAQHGAAPAEPERDASAHTAVVAEAPSAETTAAQSTPPPEPREEERREEERREEERRPRRVGWWQRRSLF